MVPVHPGAKLSSESQCSPCQDSVWATDLKATDEEFQDTDEASITGACRNTTLFYKQVFLFIHNTVKAILSA